MCITDKEREQLPIATAIVRARELFEQSPHLLMDEPIWRGQLLTWTDLKLLQVYAASKFNEETS